MSLKTSGNNGDSNPKEYPDVDTKPVKRFFVEMLTRDIAVEDAILDLLDNCVDGILRTLSADQMKADKPYKGFRADIQIADDSFTIADNCGGIPWDAHERAFRMGRPTGNYSSSVHTVGVYGIGMKRAIFKMGNDAEITTRNENDSYRIRFSPDWMQNERTWEIPVEAVDTGMVEDGTEIVVSALHPGIKERFQADKFVTDLINRIQTHYSIIIGKGFAVSVNGSEAKPIALTLRFSSDDSSATAVRPYVYRTQYNGVDVFVAVGLREPIPDEQRIIEEQEEKKYSSSQAGWTIICNDRVVLYCNTDELTGWGTSGVPRYHTQFIAISGVVEFSGDPANLPTTTTKRGLDYSSSLYQQTLNRMKDGTAMFVQFTNKWKTLASEAKSIVSPVTSVNFETLRDLSLNLDYRKVQSPIGGEQSKPKLPMPVKENKDVRITFTRERERFYELASKFQDELEEVRERDVPKRVGEACFEFAYEHLVAQSGGVY